MVEFLKIVKHLPAINSDSLLYKNAGNNDPLYSTIWEISTLLSKRHPRVSAHNSYISVKNDAGSATLFIKQYG
jgi:hypothetical protein